MQQNVSQYLVNSLIDQVFRGQPPVAPANTYVALIVANQGVRQNAITYPAASYVTEFAGDGSYHLYYSAAGGTSAGSAPSFPGVPGEAIVDNTVTWVEQTANLKTGVAITEPTIGTGSYARIGIASTLVDWAGTQGATTTSPSTGTSGTTSNNANVTFAVPTADWAAAPAAVWGIALYDALSGGNLLSFGPITNPQSVHNGSAAPTFAISAIDFFLA